MTAVTPLSRGQDAAGRRPVSAALLWRRRAQVRASYGGIRARSRAAPRWTVPLQTAEYIHQHERATRGANRGPEARNTI
jgi:hypothetical protein